MTRATYHHGDLERALIDAALLVIERDGPDAISLRQIARDVGVNHTAVYRHFEDKRALLAAVAEQGFSALALAMRNAGQTAPPENAPARLSKMMSAYVAFALDHPSHFRVMLGPRLNEDDRHPSLETPITEAFGLLVDCLKDGMARGQFAQGHARDLAVSVWTVAHGYATLVLMRRIRVRSRDVAEHYFQTVITPFLNGLCC